VPRGVSETMQYPSSPFALEILWRPQNAQNDQSLGFNCVSRERESPVEEIWSGLWCGESGGVSSPDF
jgi:hypothetical protein